MERGRACENDTERMICETESETMGWDWERSGRHVSIGDVGCDGSCQDFMCWLTGFCPKLRNYLLEVIFSSSELTP